MADWQRDADGRCHSHYIPHSLVAIISFLRRRLSRKGFTLIDVILYVGLASILIVTLTRFIILIFSIRNKTEAQADVQQNLRYAMDRITTTVVNSTGIIEANNLTKRLVVQSGSALNQVKFSLSGDSIYVVEPGRSDLEKYWITSPLMRVVDFDVTRLDPIGGIPIVKIKITGTDKREDLDDLMILESAVSPRL